MLKKLGAAILLVIVVGIFMPGCKGDPQMRAKMRQEMIMGKMDKIAEGLSLSDEQKVKFNDIKTEITSRMDNFSKDREKTKEEIVTELQKENPDVNLIAGKVKEKIDTGSTRAKEGVDLFVKFYNILDKEQKKILVSKVHDKLDALKTLQEE